MYYQHIQQPQYQQLKVEGHLRVCGSGEFWYIYNRVKIKGKDYKDYSKQVLLFFFFKHAGRLHFCSTYLALSRCQV